MPVSPNEWSARSVDLARLLARTGLGDRPAFAALYERSAAHLYAVILRINRDRAQAEDILQEVYVKVWRAAQTFDAAQSQPLTWLTSIARHLAIDSLRRATTQPQLQDPGSFEEAGQEKEDVYERVVDSTGEPVALLSRAADARALEACMQGLSALQRQCVALAFFHGLSHAEVAEQLRQPLGSVKSWVRRALLALKGCLQDAVQRDAEPR